MGSSSDPAFQMLPVEAEPVSAEEALDAAEDSALEDPLAIEAEPENPVPFGRTWKWDEDRGRFVRGEGGPRGVDSIGLPFEWTLAGPVTKLSPTSIEKSGAGEFNAQAYSEEGYEDHVFARWKVPQKNAGLLCALNTNPGASLGFADMDYAINNTAAGTLIIREEGVEVAAPGAYNTGDEFVILFDGEKVIYFQNGIVLREVARAPGPPLHFDSTFNQVGGKITEVAFGPVGGGGSPLEVRGIDSLQEWIRSTAATAAGVHPIFSPGYGIEDVDEMIGLASPLEVAADYEEQLRKALVSNHDRIAEVDEFEMEWDPSEGVLIIPSFDIITDDAEAVAVDEFTITPDEE